MARRLEGRVVIATHNAGLVARFPHPELRLDDGTLSVIAQRGAA